MDYNYATVTIILKNGMPSTKTICYCGEPEKLLKIHGFIAYHGINNIFLVIFHTEKDGCKLLNKALWGI
jgi:hypothetical protein